MINATDKNNRAGSNYFSKSNSYQVMAPEKSQINYLNRLGSEIAPDTYEVCNECYPDKKGYTYFNDARVMDSFRGIRTVLDSPATVGWDKGMNATFYEKNASYKLGSYKNYSDMNNSQINYYVDKSVSEPFFNPIYTLSSEVDKIVFVSPMDSVQPAYNKIPITSTLNSVSKDSATRDQLSFRDDLISKQQSG
jgi:hypothetical protein